MRIFVIVIAAFAAALGLAATGQAQSLDRLADSWPEKPVSPGPVEIKVRENRWTRAFSDQELIFLVGGSAERSGFPLGADTRRIMEEIWERETLSQSRWVDQTSGRLQTGTIQPTLYALEIVTGGESSSRRDNFSVGGVSVGTESGTSKAHIVVRVYVLTTMQVVATLVGRGEHSSTNVSDVDLSKVFRGMPWTSYRSWDRDPEFRRGLIAVGRALDDLERKLGELARGKFAERRQ